MLRSPRKIFCELASSLSYGEGMDTIRDPMSFVEKASLHNRTTLMGIFKALGLGLTIVILKLLMPDVMSGLEGTLAQFFGLTQSLLSSAQSTLNG